MRTFGVVKSLIPEGSKRCVRCDTKKPLKNFWANAKARDGRSSWCRECVNAYQRTRRPKKRPPKPPDGFKRCPMCKRTLPIDKFWKSKSRVDGLRGYCKDCYHDAPSIQAASKRYHRSEKYKATLKARRTKPEYQHHHWVRMHTISAIKLGILVPQPCEVCGNPEVEAHHIDYNRPLDVRWLCQKHHVTHGHGGSYSNPPQ